MTERKKTVLIFGITSFVGSNLAEYLKKDYIVVGTYHKMPVSLAGIVSLPCDVLEKEAVQLVLFAFKPDYTIYAVGLSSVQDCARSPEMADALNSSGLYNVLEYCQRYKSRLCCLSSSYVFSGNQEEYMEMDTPDPITVFGKNKASSEFYVQKTSLNYLIIRCPSFYGRSMNPRQKTFFEAIQTKIAKGQSFICDNSIKHGYLDIYYLCLVIKLCFEKNMQNRLLQLCSKDICTAFEFAKTYCEVFGQDAGFINKGRWPFALVGSNVNSFPSDDLRYSLNINNIENALRIELPTIKESLEFTFKRMHGVKENRSRKIKKTEGINYI